MLAEGMFIADRYEIVEKIGSGGMSDVYKAKDHVLGRFVAIKVLKKEFSEDVNFVTKFRTEAQSAARLEHPNIVNIYDVGSEYGMYYIVMEHVEGITLKSYIEKKGRLSYKEAVSIAIQVGRGIEAAHNKHIVHRDIKPQNIIISTEGKVKVTDFGIARAANNNTIHADVMGSVHYTSPEQARNGFVDGKSDIYSLGIVMYEMVTGRVPFDGDSTVAIAIQHLQDEMTPPSAYAPDLPISMEKIILKCTQKNPDRRYESISDLLVDLKKVLISPDEDFVIIAPVGQDKTRIIQKEDVAAIQQETGKAYYGDDEDSENEEGDEDGDEDDDEDGGFLNPKMEKAVTIMGIVAAVIIVAIIVVIIGSVSGLFKFGGNSNKNPDNTIQETPNTNEDETIKMIKVIGMTEKEARDALNKLGLGLKVNGSIASDDVEKNQIATQSIDEGTEVAKNTTVYVEICSGPGDVEVPSVTGLTEDQAEKKIKDKGFEAVRDYAYSDTVPEGQVVSQSPEAGKKAKKGDKITYYLSRGVETVKVPDVTNKSEEDAKKELEKAGFTVPEVTSEYNDTIPEGYVIRQTNSGEYKAKGTSIFLVISLGKQKTYYSYSVTVTPKISGDIPSDIDIKDVVIRKAGGSSEKLQVNWSYQKRGSSFVIKVSDIEGVDRGTITIIWKGTSSSGSTEEITDEYYNEYSVYFQKQ
jgi:eukaryotic-like serine/threonine-protein kinase